MKLKDKFKIFFSLRKKFAFLFLSLLILHIIFTSVFSFFIFQKLLDSQLNVIDFKTTALKTKIEQLYEQRSNVYKLPDIGRETPEDIDDPKIIKENIEKTFPGMDFSVNTIQGTVQYKEDPKLVYNKATKNYSFEITREIKFTKNLPFQSLELSIKLNFYLIIIKSLIYGSIIAALLVLPLLFLYLNKTIKPIIKIAKASKSIAGGDLGIQVKYNARDELGDLSNSFNFMSNELSKIKKIRDDLLATVSHELRSPLARIKGYAELLLDIELDKDEKDTYYRSILQEVDLLNSMAAEIIEVSRLELNKEKLFLEKMDMGFFFEILQEDLDITSKMKNVEISFSFVYGIFCSIDVEKIRRVLVNAVQNSINAKAKVINVCSYVDSNYLNINVIDDGCGIKKEYFELVFEKFYRVDKSRDRETGGFGLGLAICKGIIKEHKGDIYFEDVERGAKLVIKLPVTDRLS